MEVLPNGNGSSMLARKMWISEYQLNSLRLLDVKKCQQWPFPQLTDPLNCYVPVPLFPLFSKLFPLYVPHKIADCAPSICHLNSPSYPSWGNPDYLPIIRFPHYNPMRFPWKPLLIPLISPWFRSSNPSRSCGASDYTAARDRHPPGAEISPQNPWFFAMKMMVVEFLALRKNDGVSEFVSWDYMKFPTFHGKS